MKKRVLSALLVCGMTASLLAGCGAGAAKENDTAKTEEKTDEVTTIKMWGYKHADDSIKAMIEAFEKDNPQYKIDYVSWGYGDFSEKFATSLMPNSDGADVYYVWNGWTTEAMREGALAKVPDSIKSELDSDYLDIAKKGYMVGSDYYGVPVESNLEYGGMIVNKKLFDENNLKYPTTWAELREISGKVAKKDGDVMTMRGFDCIDWDALLNNYLAMVLQQGGSYIQKDGSVNFATTEGIKAFEEIKDMIDKGENTLDSVIDWNSTYNMVLDDAGYMGSVGTWAIAEGEGHNKKFGVDYEYVAVPQYGKTMTFTAESGWGLVVSENSDKKDAAFAFVEYFSKPENLATFNTTNTQLPARKSLCEDKSFRAACEGYEFVLDLLPKGQYVGYYDTTAMRYSIINTMIAVCTTKDYATTKDALTAMSKEISETYYDK